MRFGIVLSGCGRADGSEIHEAVVTLLAVVKAGIEPCCFAPSGNQSQVVNHLTGEREREERSMLVEAARIARGEIQDLKNLSVSGVDGVIFPGGLGAAHNLCTFGLRGKDCEVHAEVQRVVRECQGAKKPLGFICIAPVIAARLIPGVLVTIGTDNKTARTIESMGARHQEAASDEAVVDRVHRVVTTPAYMSARSIVDVERGVSRLVNEMQALIS